MSNILAIANKELRSYFASPIAYAVVGFFALAFGFMFYSFLHAFGMQSLRMGQMGMGGPVNINQMMIRPLVMQISVIVLFMLPMVTMRTYAEEKRSGTIELLLTSPVTDWQIILGKFLGALGLYATMLLVTLPSVAMLFWYGNPDWKPVATSYLGLLLLGRELHRVRAVRLEHDQEPDRRGRAHLRAPADAAARVVAPRLRSRPDRQRRSSRRSRSSSASTTSRRASSTPSSIVYYLSLITFGLFLTSRSVDSERWRG